MKSSTSIKNVLAPATAWLLAGLVALGAPAARADDLADWKHQVVDGYEQAIYLDEGGRPISDQEFFTRMRKESRNLDIETVEGSTKRITLRLHPRIDPVFTPSKNPTASGLMAWKHNMIAPYERAVYLDERGRPVTEEAFFRVMQSERRSAAMQADPDSRKLITVRLLPRGTMPATAGD